MNFKREYQDLAQSAFEQAQKKGADATEAYITDSQSVEISVNNRSVEQLRAMKDAGIGIRLLKDNKMISGSSNDLSQGAIKDMIADLMKKVPFHTPDEFNVIPGKEFGALEGNWTDNSDLISYDLKIAEASVEDKIKKAINLEAAGLDFSPKISGSLFAVYQDTTAFVYLANSNGISGWYPSSGCAGAVYLSAAEGEDRQSGSFTGTAVKYDDFNPMEVGRTAAENAIRMLGAKPIPSCEIPMVISPQVGAQLLEYIVGMLSADQTQKGKSLFVDKIEKKVAADILNLIDDGRLKSGLATNPVDGEGVPQQTTPLIVEGVLKTYLYDCYTAKKGKTKSTGNRTRSNYQSSGSIGSTNLYLKQGDIKPEEIFAGIKDGFYLTDAIGLHAGINSISGDFSIPSAGFKIKDGKLAFPVRGITIGGNLFDFLKSVEKIGDDLTWFQSTGCPTFSVESIKIGGA